MSATAVRSTRACSLAEADPGMVQSLRSYVAERVPDQGDIGEVLACVETHSQLPRGFFDRLRGRDRKQRALAVLTPSWLYTVLTDPTSGSIIPLAHRVKEMEIVDYESTPSYRMIADSGVEIIAFGPGAPRRSNTFFGLGPGSDADAFRAALKRAAAG